MPAVGPALSGAGCMLRAVLPGFRSTEVNLMAVRDSMAPVTLILRPLVKVEGLTVSATSLQAPKDARKAFEKATKAMRKGEWEESLVELQKAVRSYPRYAAAWSEIGNVYQEKGEPEKARSAFREALTIDPRFLPPYFGLAEVAMHERKWEEMAGHTGAILKLDPFGSPGAYAYDAMAHLNLNSLENAEKSARRGIENDGAGSVPKLQHLLGVVLMRKRDFAGAAAHLKHYLEAAPRAPDADFVKRQIAACEAEHAASAAKPAVR
jgi:tetratricopeptide (TPR) repeat protein